ncbi:hypothetical protein [Teichococcus aestuarii]|uniref:Uncharacterized protein n=1 Tax=Teichococcus aestuarii TaxID=568898 RepID=A0A2U1V7J2_9PROT|nr:hypothetical protein [Pseudoroseomonas aestuarii]PWC29854.1 hypothetical protein CR165_02965 [Pseudoroseomonas aestuarii]
MDDPNLFGTHFRGESWGAWRAFLAALFALPMDEAQEAIYHHHTGRTALPGGASKEAVLAAPFLAFGAAIAFAGAMRQDFFT